MGRIHQLKRQVGWVNLYPITVLFIVADLIYPLSLHDLIIKVSFRGQSILCLKVYLWPHPRLCNELVHIFTQNTFNWLIIVCLWLVHLYNYLFFLHHENFGQNWQFKIIYFILYIKTFAYFLYLFIYLFFILSFSSYFIYLFIYLFIFFFLLPLQYCSDLITVMAALFIAIHISFLDPMNILVSLECN